MRRLIAGFTAAVASFLTVVSVTEVASQTKPQPLAEVASVVQGNTAFAFDLYGQLRSQQGNLFFSPYSISSALAITYAGARGSTASEMARVLHFTIPHPRLHPAIAALTTTLDAAEEQSYQLSIANRLWGQSGYGFLEPFLKITQDSYGAVLEEVDFAGATEQARSTINEWVAGKTQNKIRNLIAEGTLTSDTLLVLTNAIYFKAAWGSPFKPNETKAQPFTVRVGQQVQVPMMHQTEQFDYAALDGLQVLELPYVGYTLSMVILLPDKVDGLAELELRLTPENLKKWISSLSGDLENPVEVWVPKFKVNSQFELKNVLSAMGMPLAFSNGSDFSGMNGKKDLFISNVIHKTFVDLNEKGTEAAGATAVIGGTRGGSGEPATTFRCDRPFIFLIRHPESGTILFLGRVVNPLS